VVGMDEKVVRGAYRIDPFFTWIGSWILLGDPSVRCARRTLPVVTWADAHCPMAESCFPKVSVHLARTRQCPCASRLPRRDTERSLGTLAAPIVDNALTRWAADTLMGAHRGGRGLTLSPAERGDLGLRQAFRRIAGADGKAGKGGRYEIGLVQSGGPNGVDSKGVYGVTDD